MRIRDLALAALTGLVVVTFAFAFLVALPGMDALLAVLLYAALSLLVAAVVYRRRRGRKGRSVWDAIPRWQYTGRHVESGGMTVDGQEQAVEEIRERAEARESRRS